MYYGLFDPPWIDLFDLVTVCQYKDAHNLPHTRLDERWIRSSSLYSQVNITDRMHEMN